jgi:predicted NBD/HSP70 family sugar kinase
MKVLVIDVGGTNVKLKAHGPDEPRKFPSGPTLGPAALLDRLAAATTGWHFDHVTIGVPAPVMRGRIRQEPVNLGRGWVGFDFQEALGRPVKIVNDAAMQALGSYEGGRMLFLGLGTGLGTALVVEGVVAPMELGHLPYKKGRTFEEYVGQGGLTRLGRNKWQAAVFDVVARLRNAFMVDYVVLGGGNIKKLDETPPGCQVGDNRNAFLGGLRVWEDTNAR